MSPTLPDARTRLLEAATTLVRQKGYQATSVDEICAAAGLTKGSFFHHFRSKEALAVAAADRWRETTGALFARAPYHDPADPLARLLAYVDFRKALIRGETCEYTCLAGTMVQEVHATSVPIRQACEQSISAHAATLEADIAAAMQQRGLTGKAGFTPQSLALHTQAVIQGAFVLAKAGDGHQVALDCLDHLRRYLELLFSTPPSKE